jgi:outer membrane protein assembly factor BamA
MSRPFYALDTRWAHDLSFAETRDVLRIYQDGDLSAAHNRRVTEIVAGFSARLTKPTPTTVWRVGAGYRFTAQEYPGAAREERLDPESPITHRWAGPYASLQFTEHRFLTCTGLIVPDRDVDVNLGTQADLGVFVSPRVGAWRTTSRLAFGASASRGWGLPGAGVFVSRGAATVLTGGGETTRVGFSGSARAWWQLSSTHVVMAGGEARASIRPEPGYRVYLGGSPGLRGYDERAFQGTRSALFTLEDRKYASWTPAGLVQFGAAAFVEAGAVGGDAVTAGRGRILVDAGVGLRIATLRASANGTIRVDVAYPLTRPPDGRRRAELVIGYRNDF